MNSKFLATFAVAAALSTNVMGIGLGVQLGPFELGLGLGVNDNGGDVDNRLYRFEDPICYAIGNRRLLEMDVEWKERVSKTETTSTLKRITIEPYLFGRAENGQPVLRGNIVAERVLREISVKYGDEAQGQFDEEQDVSGPLSGTYRTPPKGKSGRGVQTVNIRRVASIRVVEGGHFVPPKDYNQIFQGDVAEVICTVTPSNGPRS